MSERTYPLQQVLMSLELSEGTVTSWTKRGTPGLVIAPSGRGRGRSRSMPIEGVYRLAFIKALLNSQIPVGAAAEIADECLAAIRDRPPIDTMTIYRWSAREMRQIVFNGEPSTLPSPWSAVILFAKDIVEDMDKALSWQYPPGFDAKS